MIVLSGFGFEGFVGAEAGGCVEEVVEDGFQVDFEGGCEEGGGFLG